MKPVLPERDVNSARNSGSAGSVLAGTLMPWLPVFGALLVNFKVLYSGFLYDDFVHLFAVTDRSFLEAISHSGTQHLLQSYKLVVWLLSTLFGPNPLPFFMMALVLHLVNVRILYEIVQRLTGMPALAAVCAGFWGMGPLAVGSLAWISVHGQIYASVAILWLLLDTVRLGDGQLEVSRGLLVRHGLLLLIAATSYGTGMVAALVFPFVAAFWGAHVKDGRRLLSVYALSVVAILLLYLATAESQGQSANALQRLLQGEFTRLFILLDAVASLWSMGFAGLLLGPFVTGGFAPGQGEWLVPIARLVTLFLALPLLLAGLVLSDPRTRLRILALLVIASAIYGLIALARSGGVLPFQPETLRFQYLATLFIAILLGLVVSVLVKKLSHTSWRWAPVLAAAVLSLAIYPFHITSKPVVENFHTAGQEKRYKAAMARLEQALAAGAGAGAAEIYIPNDPFKVFIWNYTPEYFPGLAGLFVIHYPENTVNGKPVYFVEESPQVVEQYQAQKGSRTSGLLLGP